MAENLNYNTDDSKCYKDLGSNCSKYGRLYNWGRATTLKVCPAGWHLPSDVEWDILVDYVGDARTAGAKLKVKSGWNAGCSISEDSYGFSALPGGWFGKRGSENSYGDIEGTGYWWSATENNTGGAYFRSMGCNNAEVVRAGNIKASLYSVRCVQD